MLSMRYSLVHLLAGRGEPEEPGYTGTIIL